MDDSAAYSRGSSPLNNSVLTEDTDDYMVGDRVWVHGTRPGYIQFIGETKFASGEWAGVVLDKPNGKNDGSVNGVRYFQCEPYRGIFARLYRLTRYPLGQKDDSYIYNKSGIARKSRSSTPEAKIRTTTTRVTKTPIIPSYALPARPAKLVTTVTTTTTTNDGYVNHLRVGDRVIVDSNSGVQTGIIRYYGKTGFASGDWVGIELDEPFGKNDGSVAGRRYFTCPMKYGLFAPVYKVAKSVPSRTITRTRIVNTKADSWKPSRIKV
jgi:CAP-Gly domain-containing linker protein 1